MSHLRTLRLFGATMVIGALFSMPSLAQSYGTFAAAKIPFSFQLGSQVLPAGMYQFRMSAEHILEVRGETESAFVMVLSEADRVLRPDASLRFLQSDGYQLREIYAPGHGVHLYCLGVRAKRRNEAIAQRPAADQMVTVAAAETRH